MKPLIAPPLLTTRDICGELQQIGYAFLKGSEVEIPASLQSAFQTFKAEWDHLELDKYLQNGAKFRYRRYNYFYYHPQADELLLLPYEPFFQSEDANAYAGGMVRAFAPLRASAVANPFMHALIRFSFSLMPEAKEKSLLSSSWKVEVHQVRVISRPSETGEPSPEGIHRDGGASGFVYLMDRKNAKGAESAVYDNDRKLLASKALEAPMDSLLFLDPRVLHHVTPLEIADPAAPAIRDVFILGFFHEPELGKP